MSWGNGGPHSGSRWFHGKDGVAGSIPAGGSTPNQQHRPGNTPGLSHRLGYAAFKCLDPDGWRVEAYWESVG
jgi:hypothetical protein